MVGLDIILGLEVLRMLLEAAHQPAIVSQRNTSTLQNPEVNIPPLSSMVELISMSSNGDITHPRHRQGIV